MRLVLTVSVKVTAVLVTSPGFIGGGGEGDRAPLVGVCCTKVELVQLGVVTEQRGKEVENANP